MEQHTGSKLGKEYVRLCIVTLLINLYAGYIMQIAGIDEAQAGIKTGGKNISNLRLADDINLMGRE